MDFRHGGYRPGSGRPQAVIVKKNLTIRISPSLNEQIKEIAEEEGISRNQLIEDTLMKAFIQRVNKKWGIPDGCELY